MAELTRPRGRSTPETRHVGLVALALAQGRPSTAVEYLAEMGVSITAPTLGKWRRTYPEEYREAQVKVAPQIEAQLAETHQRLAMSATNVEERAIDELDRRLTDDPGALDPRELSQILQRSAIASAIHTDKAQLLKGQPTQIIKRDLGEVMRALRAKGVEIEGVAVEID